LHLKVLKIENENAEGHLYVNHTVINLHAHRDKVTKSKNIIFFKVLLPQIPSVAQDDLKHVANEIFKSMRYGLVIHRDQDRFVKNSNFFRNFKFYFSLKLYRLSQCRIFVVDDDNVTKLSQLTPYELNLQRKRNIMVRKF